MPVAHWMRRLAVAGVLLCFTVVVLGAYVRLSAAGLGCPDWPGCYGHLTPMDAGHSLGKAWREMLHRYAAGALALVILGLTALAISARRRRPVSLPLALALLATLIVQAALGMLTVTWQLEPLIVTLHLLFGMTTLGLLWWLTDRKSTRLNSSHSQISYAVFCLKKKIESIPFYHIITYV